MLPDGFGALSILIVDDQPQTRRLLRGVLRSLGLERVSEADSVASAFAAIKASPPDLVFTDWDMPGATGLELVRMIRTHPESPDPSLPVLMLTAHGGSANVVRGREAGASDFLVKPFSPARLQERILDVVLNPRGFVLAPNYRGTDRRRAVRAVGSERRQPEQMPPGVEVFSPNPVLQAKVSGDVEALKRALQQREGLVNAIRARAAVPATAAAAVPPPAAPQDMLDALSRQALAALDNALQSLSAMSEPLRMVRAGGMAALPPSAERVMHSLQGLIDGLQKRDSYTSAVQLHLLALRAILRSADDPGSMRIAEELAAQLERIAAEEDRSTTG
jgi:CheY-like chemotaxis protein